METTLENYQLIYRRLTDSELKELEKEFIQFLCANTVTADDWLRIKAEHVDQAHQLIDRFSDVVMEKALSNVRFLEHRQEKEVMLFHCKDDKLELIGFNVPETFDVDLRDEVSIKNLMNDSSTISSLSVFKVEKPYGKQRELEMYEMTNNGCLVSDGALFYLLEKML